MRIAALEEVERFVEGTTLGDVLLRVAAAEPEREALLLPGERLSYGELTERALGVARALRGLGLRRGERACLLMPNCVDMIASLFGTALLGVVAVPLNTRFRTREIAYTVRDSGAACVLTSDIIDEHVDFAELLAESLPGLCDTVPDLRHVVLLGQRTAPGMLDGAGWAASAATVSDAAVVAESRNVRIRDELFILYTSGTTANPKGCVLTHEAVVRDWIATGDRLGMGPDDTFWSACPLFHMAGTGPMIAAMSRGGRFATQTHFDPAVSIDLIESEAISHLYPAFPPITMGMLRHPDYRPERFRAVRATMNVAPPDTLRLMQELTPEAVQVSSYGLTEATGTVCIGTLDDTLEQRTTTSGKPLEGNEVRIVAPDTGAVLPPDVEGEIQVRGLSTMERYHNDPERTAETILPDGWIRTGDLGRMDGDGRVTYLARLKDMLKVGGENVAPSEIESHLSTHPAVQLAQVVGRDDERLVEVPVAFVQLANGCDATAEELIDHCRGQIASFKVPREIRFVTEWPMSATKIQKYKLREQLESEEP